MSATYDSRDFLASWTDGLGRSETYERDANGNIVAITDRAGRLTRYRFDDQLVYLRRVWSDWHAAERELRQLDWL